jgi:enamine deaminase RidA (YjgF/YER057c/UK114 family)
MTKEVPMQRVLLPDGWPRPKGYSNGISADAGKLIFCGGQIGWTPEGVFEHKDFIGQFRQTLLNIIDVLDAAGAGPEHMVRMTWFVVDREDYVDQLREIGGVYREVIGKHFPAMSVVFVSGLVEKEAKVEIEVTAVKP